MPAYNLSGVIGDSIERVVSVTADLGAVEIIVCDDGSGDNTSDEASTAAGKFDNVRVVRHDVNQGKGAALTTAFDVSTMPVVAFLDADLDLPPDQLPGLLEEFRSSAVDVLVGLKQGSMEPGRYPGYRRVLSKVFSGTIRLMFALPVEETQTGLKLFTREALTYALPRLSITRYAFDLELVVALQRGGFTIGSAPVTLAQGASDRGLSAQTLWEMGRDTIRIWLRTISGRL